MRLRLKRMARWAYLIHQRKSEGLTINEAVCFDGLENFAGSQFDPNNINHAIGRDSLFIYDFNFCPLNRKGRTSDRQKRILVELELAQGRYPPRAIRQSAKEIFKRLAERVGSRDGKLTLVTDEHFQYRRALGRDLRSVNAKIDHVTVSSKKRRDFQNLLFSVNHADLLIRSNCAAFTRETISFSKTASAMVDKYMLFTVWKNFMRPQFTKKQIRRPHAHRQSPAMHLGLESKILRFGDFFSQKENQAGLELSPDWQLFYECKVPFLRKLVPCENTPTS